MNRIVARRGPDPNSWATTGTFSRRSRVWSSSSCSLVVDAEHPEHCGVAEGSDGVVLAFKGFLHGPDVVPKEHRQNASAIAEHLVREFHQHGLAGISHLWGRYQMYVLDPRDDSLLVVSDPYGSEEIFRTTGDGPTVVGSSLDALASSGTQLVLDRGVEDFLLVYGFVPRPGTLFCDIERQGAGVAMGLHRDGVRFQPIETPSPWSPVDWTGAGETEVVDTLYDAFMRSLEELMPPESDVSVLLGGFDSALVAAGLARLGKRVHTYTFRYEDERYNQAHVDSVAELCGGSATWVSIDAETIRKGLESYRNQVSAPTNWPAYVIQTSAVAERIREDGFGLTFSGDGCDNLFFGYPLTFRRGQMVERLSRIPRPLTAIAERVASAAVVQDVVGRPAVVGAGALRSAQLEHPERGYLTFRILEEAALSRLRNGDDPQPHQSIRQQAAQLAAPFSDRDPVQLSYLGKKCLTPSAMKVSASTAVSGVGIVSPYQHRGVVDLAASMPTSLLRPSGDEASAIGKYALAKMAESKDLLPKDIVHQPKMAAADAPIDKWYPGPLRDTLLELVEDLPFDANDRMVTSMLKPTLGERAYQRVIGVETNNVVNVSHDISLLATYGAVCGLAA